MILLLRYGLVLFLLSAFAAKFPLLAQTGPMTEMARNIWLEKNPEFPVNTDFQFDRITGHGELVVYERFSPASFIILKNAPEGYLLVGYSFRNQFFGSTAGLANQPILLDALEAAGPMDPGKLKGTRSLTSSVGPLVLTQWGQGQLFNYYCPRDSRGPNGRVYVLAFLRPRLVHTIGQIWKIHRFR
ncbi:MAG: hypothetical protein NTV01_01735 [Bacteroidia bacterium]|nr:hypothetical protein [Bacteroidia bacterium]